MRSSSSLDSARGGRTLVFERARPGRRPRDACRCGLRPCCAPGHPGSRTADARRTPRTWRRRICTGGTSSTGRARRHGYACCRLRTTGRARTRRPEQRSLCQQRQPLPVLWHVHREAVFGLLTPEAIRSVVAARGRHREPAPPGRGLGLGAEPDPLPGQPERRRPGCALGVVEGYRFVRPGICR